ncbi:hypothetical protein HYC85_024069 [Camellia sinensis]|uniref:Uncharacterized protein n=1 Tax=Camellia sinensis TaxID=4442 RepID=A0A7J7G717_CAMSI|nr:hypothetical protein HYC85_024069 [Camellia sinensis]
MIRRSCCFMITTTTTTTTMVNLPNHHLSPPLMVACQMLSCILILCTLCTN